MRNRLRHAIAVSVIAASAFTLTSCSEYTAKNSLEKSTKLLERMSKELNGELHAKPQLESIRANINRANQELQSGQAAQAKTSAKAALTEAQQALISVLVAEANKSFNDANDEIRVGDINQASRIDSVRYQTIIELKQRMDEERAKNDNEAVIATARTIINEMRTLLNPLETRAKRAQSTAESKLQDLKSEGGTQYAPEAVIEVQDLINTANKISTQDRDYGLAQVQFEDATRRAEEGIDQVKRAKCDESMTVINSLMATALLEGAKVYVPDQWQTAERLIDTLIADFNSNKYDRVLLGANEVKPKVEELVYSTKRAAADARINTLETNIRDLTEGGAREYLPGRVEELQAILAQAREIRSSDTIQAFDDIKALSLRGIEVYESINRAFDEIALSRIREASNSLETTTVVYGQMGTIFDPVQGEMTGEEKAFEAQKIARQGELGQQIENARRNLQDAFLNQKDGRYKQAIVLAGEVKSRSEAVLGEVYHVVAHNAAIELANLITRYERDGAREYSRDDLTRSQGELEAVKTAILEKRYRDAVSAAAQARANVELMAQGIAGRATVDIRDARAALRDAGSELTRKYRGDQLAEVSRLIASAEDDLGGARLKSAVEKARRATELARQAQRESYMTLAQENIDRTRSLIAKASDAGAELYAGRELTDAKNLLASSQTLFAGQDYEKASTVSQTAAERAEAALYRKVIDAESALASARAVGGWEYDPASLGEASSRVRQAREEIDNANYAAGGRLASGARANAENISDDAKNRNFREAVARIRRNLNVGTSQGINFFQPQDSAAIRTRLFELENMYTLAKYDLVMAELAKLEGHLRGTLESTGKTVFDVAGQQDARLDALLEGGARSFAAEESALARKNLEYARQDYRRGMYKSAHSALERAIAQIDEISNRRDKEVYNQQVTDLMARYNNARADFGKILGMGSRALKDLALRNGTPRPLSISSRMTAAEFRETLDRLYSEAIALTPPRGYEDLHSMLVDAFNNGRMAAINFQKMAAFDVSSPREVEASVDDAFRHMNTSTQILGLVQERLLGDERLFRAGGANQIGMAGTR